MMSIANRRHVPGNLEANAGGTCKWGQGMHVFKDVIFLQQVKCCGNWTQRLRRSLSAPAAAAKACGLGGCFGDGEAQGEASSAAAGAGH